jgi:hypothetical protein
MVVLVKQVPDTQNLTGEAMKIEGIFIIRDSPTYEKNPEKKPPICP